MGYSRPKARSVCHAAKGPLLMRTTIALALAATVPLVLTPAVLAPTAQAAAASLTCNGHVSLAIAPGVTSIPTDQIVTATSRLGSADSLPGATGNSTCQSPDNNATAATYAGGIMTINTVQAGVTCDNPGSAVVGGGQILWINGEISTLGAGSVNTDHRDQGNGVINLTLPVTNGPFKDKTVVIDANTTIDLNACTTKGISSAVGTTVVNIQ